MSTFNLSPVAFHGNTLFIINHNNEPYTPMKPIVEGMGLTWPSQQQKLTANKERWGITIIVIPTQSGTQEALCMPVRKLPAFFGSISPNKVRKEIRERIILYQNECDDVLWKYWTGQQVERAPLLDRLSTSKDAERKELTVMINAWVGVAPIHYAGARAIVNAHIGVKTVDDMTVTQVKRAIQFVQGKINEAGQTQQALPAAHYAFEAQVNNLVAGIQTTIRQLKRQTGELHHLCLTERKRSPHFLTHDKAGNVNSRAWRTVDPLHHSLDYMLDAIEQNALLVKAAN